MKSRFTGIPLVLCIALILLPVTAMAAPATRTINCDQFTLEIPDVYAYCRISSLKQGTLSTVHFVVVTEAAVIRCTRYAPVNTAGFIEPYSISPYISIYFDQGPLWPTVEHAREYDDRETVRFSQGSSISVENGNEYGFGCSRDAGGSGGVDVIAHTVRLFVVPAATAASIGGSRPHSPDDRITIHEFSVQPGAGSAPVSYVPPAYSPRPAPGNGWYRLMYDHVSIVVSINIDASGNAELNDGTRLYVENRGNNQITLRMADGRYLGITGAITDGARARAVSSPYLWNIYFENNGGFFNNYRYSLRPSTNTTMVLNASGRIQDGTPIILSAHTNMNVPANAEFTFYPEDDPSVLTILSYPAKTAYRVGEGFDTAGLNAVINIFGVSTNINGRITFYTSNVELTQSRPFTTTGTKVVELRYDGRKVGQYTVTVTSSGAAPAPATPGPAAPGTARTPADGWYNLRAMNNYLNLDASGNAELRNNTATGNQAYYVENKGNNQITLRMADGRYLGIADAITDGVRVRAVSSPYLWNTYTENNADIYSLRPPANTGKVLNASGERNTNGTPIILWAYANMNAPNHAEFRFIPTTTPSNRRW